MPKCVKCQNIYPQSLGHQCVDFVTKYGTTAGVGTTFIIQEQDGTTSIGGPTFTEYYRSPPNSIIIQETAIKHDSEKLDLSMLPPEGLEEATKAFMDGMKKYGRHQYRSGMEWSRLVSAMMRHINQFNKGEDKASDSGVHHLGHVIANCMMLLDYYYNGLGTDNRRTHSTKQENKDKV